MADTDLSDADMSDSTTTISSDSSDDGLYQASILDWLRGKPDWLKRPPPFPLLSLPVELIQQIAELCVISYPDDTFDLLDLKALRLTCKALAKATAPVLKFLLEHAAVMMTPGSLAELEALSLSEFAPSILGLSLYTLGFSRETLFHLSTHDKTFELWGDVERILLYNQEFSDGQRRLLDDGDSGGYTTTVERLAAVMRRMPALESVSVADRVNNDSSVLGLRTLVKRLNLESWEDLPRNTDFKGTFAAKLLLLLLEAIVSAEVRPQALTLEVQNLDGEVFKTIVNEEGPLFPAIRPVLDGMQELYIDVGAMLPGDTYSKAAMTLPGHFPEVVKCTFPFRHFLAYLPNLQTLVLTRPFSTNDDEDEEPLALDDENEVDERYLTRASQQRSFMEWLAQPAPPSSSRGASTEDFTWPPSTSTVSSPPIPLAKLTRLEIGQPDVYVCTSPDVITALVAKTKSTLRELSLRVCLIPAHRDRESDPTAVMPPLRLPRTFRFNPVTEWGGVGEEQVPVYRRMQRTQKARHRAGQRVDVLDEFARCFVAPDPGEPDFFLWPDTIAAIADKAGAALEAIHISDPAQFESENVREDMRIEYGLADDAGGWLRAFFGSRQDFLDQAPGIYDADAYDWWRKGPGLKEDLQAWVEGVRAAAREAEKSGDGNRARFLLVEDDGWELMVRDGRYSHTRTEPVPSYCSSEEDEDEGDDNEEGRDEGDRGDVITTDMDDEDGWEDESDDDRIPMS